jgi:dsDNA-specific endonuclease/ATPase MutS2
LVGFAVASVGAPVPYVKPEIVERGEGVLHLEQARHPCLELVSFLKVYLHEQWKSCCATILEAILSMCRVT